MLRHTLARKTRDQLYAQTVIVMIDVKIYPEPVRQSVMNENRANAYANATRVMRELIINASQQHNAQNGEDLHENNFSFCWANPLQLVSMMTIFYFELNK